MTSSANQPFHLDPAAARTLDRRMLVVTVIFWLAHFALLASRAAVSPMKSAHGIEPTIARFLVTVIAMVLCWGVYAILKRCPSREGLLRFGQAAAVSLVACAVMNAANSAIFWIVIPEVRGDQLDLAGLLINYTYFGIEFIAWSAIYATLVSSAELRDRERRLAAAESAAHQAQLRALRLQMQPHFLFNTLNTLSGLIALGRRGHAEQVILDLSAILRRALTAAPDQLEPVGEEIEAQLKYLAIERARFPDRLDVRTEIEPDSRAALGPPMILQPLVENAIKHAVAPAEGARRRHHRGAATGRSARAVGPHHRRPCRRRRALGFRNRPQERTRAPGRALRRSGRARGRAIGGRLDQPREPAMDGPTLMRVLIADDEPVALERLALALSFVPEAELVARAKTGREAVRLIKELKPDVALLDIQMPAKDGFEVVRALAGEDWLPEVIFVTAFDAFAVQAFEVQAVDYLLKPAPFERIREALRRAQARLQARASDARFAELQRLFEAIEARRSGGLAGETELWAPDRGGLTRLPMSDIHRIDAEGDYVRVRLVGGASHLIKETISALEERLDPARFLRVHRSTIISLARVKSVRRRAPRGLVVLMAEGETVRVGPNYAARTLERLQAPRWRGDGPFSSG